MKFVTATVLLISLSATSVVSAADDQLDTRLSINVKDTPMKGVLEMVAAKAGLQLVLEQDPNINISLAQGNTTVKKLLEKFVEDQQVEYLVEGNKLIITKRRTINNGLTNSHLIQVKYGSASDLSSKVSSVMGPDERIMVDERNNSLVFMGSARSYEKVIQLINLFDQPSKQIMIEAQIVETSSQFLQNYGIALGDWTNPTMTKPQSVAVGGLTQTAGPTTPNMVLNLLAGKTKDGRMLSAKISAAEADGEAKVISRPKVFTLNNQTARIESGITYNIKTLSTAQSTGTTSGGGGNTGGVLTGGVTSVTAGLSLSILPLLVGEDQIKLTVDINNSQPDEGSAVDGIPGILKNAANTSVIVKNGQTAILAGLIKHNKSNSTSGVPILSSIPILGWLFSSNSKNDKNNELVIFITPTVDDGKIEKIETPPEVAKRMPATAPDSDEEDSYGPTEE